MLTSILIVTLFLGGSNTYLTSVGKDMDKKIAAVIEDEKQQKEIQALVEEAQDFLKYYNSNILYVLQNGQMINSEYKSEVEDFNLWVDILSSEREEYMEKLEDIHLKLVKSMTKEQWNLIVHPVE